MSGSDGHKTEHGRQYVDRVLEDTQRYAHDVLAENERLQRLVASLESERAQLAERNGILQGIERENQALQDVLASIEREKERLQLQLAVLREDGERRARDQSHLRDELATIAERSQGFSQQLLQIERQNSNLASLYVATYQLHGSVERGVVLATIQEILANLVGTEQVAIFELADGGRRLAALSVNGVDPGRFQGIVLGQGPIGRAAATGELFVAEPGAAAAEEPDLTACIPLKLDGDVIGAIAIFRLLPQKQGLGDLDRELFELLATHAATALYCASLHERLGTHEAAR
jgi:hypothetical protein